MAPRRRNGGEGAESQAVHQLGVRGRKTGVALSNTGEVDEHGMLPLDNVWSSPVKGDAPAHDDEDDEDDEDDDAGSEEMELADPSSAGPGPRTLLKNQHSLQYPPQRRSSPLDDSGEATVTRKLNFPGQPKRGPKLNGANGRVEEEDEDEEEDELEPDEDVEAAADADDDVDMVDDEPEFLQPLEDDDEEPEEEEVEEAPVVKAPLKGRGRPKQKVVADVDDEPEQPPSSQKKRGRPKKTASEEQPAASPKQRGRPPKNSKPAFEAPELDPPASSRKRGSAGRPSDNDVEQSEEVEEEEPRSPKRQKTQKQATKTAPAKPGRKPAAAKSEPAKPRGRPGRKPKQLVGGEDAGEASFMALQKGPPMPKRRGLMSVKRDADEIQQTRSGRHSYRPLHYWAGEQVIAEADEQHDMFTNDRDFVVRSLKEIRRVEEEDTRPSRKGPRGKGRPKTAKPRMKAVEEEEEPELEEWEINPGTVMSEVISWDPSYETHPPGDEDQVHINEEQIAVSGEAVETREIRDATFKFGKTLTMPFMGAGLVDLPPGAEKRPKNSRKMHMVFFVHTGKVSVTVNEGRFRISAGGQWFVPRGNYYSITNDYEKPARIFFSQACEVSSQNAETSQLMGA